MFQILCNYVSLLLLSCLFCTGLYAQTTQASILGRVLNNEGQAQPGATVLVRNESTGFETRTLTNTQGDFTFKELPLGGPYTVTITHSGFGEQKRSGYSLNQGDAVHVDLQLQPQEQHWK